VLCGHSGGLYACLIDYRVIRDSDRESFSLSTLELVGFEFESAGDECCDWLGFHGSGCFDGLGKPTIVHGRLDWVIKAFQCSSCI